MAFCKLSICKVILSFRAWPACGYEDGNDLDRLRGDPAFRCIRHHWPTNRLTVRGDVHYGRPELMDFCEKHGFH